ncbi:hypothetical protein [Streptomyces sp. NPDC048611]|uniref:hypothetical protein n=1 Tax=Streptomyces sp. NPDC048611 TaxID=3155635 RepID=UPI003423B91C
MSWNQHTEADVDANGSTSMAAASAGSTFRRRGRLIAAASLVAVASLALTACGGDGQNTPEGSTKVSTSPQPEESSAGAASNGSAGDRPSKDGAAEGQQKSPAGKTGGNSGGAGGGTGGSGSGAGPAGGSEPAPKGKGVNATVSGVLKYMAPGKLTVAPASGTEQAFFIGSQTKTLGAATICASNGNVTMDSKGNGTSPCTEEQLEKAAKMGSVEVQVTIKGGVATKVVEHYRS